MNHSNQTNQQGGKQYVLTISQMKAYHHFRFFKCVEKFETRTQLHCRYIDFDLSRLPYAQPYLAVETLPIARLANGLNLNVRIKAQITRIIQFKNKAFCLLWDRLQQLDEAFFPMVIVFPSEGDAQLWCSQIHYLSRIKIFHPLVNCNTGFKGNFLIVRFDSMKIIPSKKLFTKDWNKAKLLANQKFQERRFKTALKLYEISLGLLWEQKRNQDRAIIHSNISRTYIDINLPYNALIYANIAIILDHTYFKSYYRKLRAQLDLKIYQSMPLIPETQLDSKQFMAAHQLFTDYMTNRSGYYNWNKIILQRKYPFGQYTNPKIVFKRISPQGLKRIRFSAKAVIKQFELLSVNKFLIFDEVRNQEVTRNVTQIHIENIKEFLKLDEHFYHKIEQIFLEVKAKYDYNPDHDAQSNKAFNVVALSHCTRAINPKNSIIFICKQQVYFTVDEETPNCTAFALNGALLCFALRHIKQNEYLTIRFLNKTMIMTHSSLTPFYNTGKRGLQAYFQLKTPFLEQNKYMTCFRYLWTNYTRIENKKGVVEELLYILERFLDWELIGLVIGKLHDDPNFPERMRWKKLILYAFQMYFNLEQQMAREIVNISVCD